MPKKIESHFNIPRLKFVLINIKNKHSKEE